MQYEYSCKKCRVQLTDLELDAAGVLPICPCCGDDMLQLELSKEETRLIIHRRDQIKKLREDYEERLSMYEEGLTHAGDVMSRRAFLINLGEEIPEIIFNGYRCRKETK